MNFVMNVELNGNIPRSCLGQKVEEKILGKKADFIRSRKGASLLLASACLISSIFISSNLSAAEVIDDSQKQTVISTKKRNSVEIINQAGFALSGNDAYSVNNSSDSFKAIKIFRAFDMKVVDGGVQKEISAINGTVSEALENAGIELPDSDDIINVALTDEVKENMSVTIDRVEYVKDTVTKTIAYKTVTKNDSTLDSGKTKVSVEGKNGSKEVTTTKKLVNGTVVDTKVTENIVKQPTDKVVLKGTKKASASSNTVGKKPSVDTGSKTITIGGKSVRYSKVLTGSGTAYTSGKGAKTATGQVAREGLVAVNPKVIPYGTRLYITTADGSWTYGYAVAADTGSALRNGSALVDLYYSSESKCVKFGRRQVKVYILD